MSVEETRRTMEADVQDLLGGPYKRHFSENVVLSLVGTDQGAQGPGDAEAWRDYLHTQAFEARPELKSMIVADGQAAAEFHFRRRACGRVLWYRSLGKGGEGAL